MAIAGTLTHQRTNSPFAFADLKRRFMDFVTAIGKHRIFLITASIAYTTALSLAPFVLIILSVASLLGQGFQNQIYKQMTGLLGEQAGNAIKLVVENADNNQKLSTISGIVGFLILAFSASAIFSQLRSSLDIINETPEARQASGIWGFIREKFLSLGLVLGFVFLLIASLGVSTFIAAIFQGREALLWTVVAFATSLLVFTLLFTAIFHFLPTERQPWKNSLIAGACATVFFLVGKHAIGLYLGNASVGSAYGAAGTLVVFLVWVYYTALTLLTSYEFSRNIFLKDDRPNRERGQGFVQHA
jgi:membrane protein